MKKSTQDKINSHLDGINRAKEICREAHRDHTNPLLLRVFREVEKERIKHHAKKLNEIAW